MEDRMKRSAMRPLTETEQKQRAIMNERLKGRKLPENWLEDALTPTLTED